jgi:hypothetical protein
MKKRPGWTLVVAVSMFATAVTTPSLAHHSVAGQFDWYDPLLWEGVVKRVDWINPHIYIYVDVVDENGEVSEWRLETLPPAMMRRAGISKKDLQGTGDVLKIEGIPARDGTRHLGFITRITFPDGHFYQLDRDRTAHRPRPEGSGEN